MYCCKNIVKFFVITQSKINLLLFIYCSCLPGAAVPQTPGRQDLPSATFQAACAIAQRTHKALKTYSAYSGDYSSQYKVVYDRQRVDATDLSRIHSQLKSEDERNVSGQNYNYSPNYEHGNQLFRGYAVPLENKKSFVGRRSVAMRQFGHQVAPSDLRQVPEDFRVVGGSPAPAHAYPWLVSNLLTAAMSIVYTGW